MSVTSQMNMKMNKIDENHNKTIYMERCVDLATPKRTKDFYGVLILYKIEIYTP